MKKKDQTVRIFGALFPKWVDCVTCGSKLSCEIGTYGYPKRCPKCQKKYEKTHPSAHRSTFFVGSGKKDVTAIGVDKITGRQYGITASGKRVPIEQTRYNTTTDPHGWRATGKKIRPFDSKGNPNI